MGDRSRQGRVSPPEKGQAAISPLYSFSILSISPPRLSPAG